jgi:hypothetical protein
MEFSATVVYAKAKKLGNLIKRIQPKVEDFLDNRFFPSAQDPPEKVSRYFFFITSIDHRTSPPGKSFEGTIENAYYQGADLLWHLAIRKYHEAPHFFNPEKIAQITTKTIKQWLTVDHPQKVTIRNPTERARLLRDCGQQLLQKYNKSFLTLLDTANGKLIAEDETGLLDLLAKFKAYEDPVKKKSFLLIKFLSRRKLWIPKNHSHLRIPVDNHLIRIALRTGIIQISPALAKSLQLQLPLPRSQDIDLRNTTVKAYQIVAAQAGRSVLELDDFFWHFGRNCCTRNTPVCVHGCSKTCYLSTKLLSRPCHNQCPLEENCQARHEEQLLELIEPNVKTWYY